MPSNYRIYYAVQSIHFAECGSNTFYVGYGVQSIGINTRFNLEQVFEMGQLEIYEQNEAIPDVELTVEKVLDGEPLLYHLATRNALSASLAGRSNKRCTVGLAIFGDSQDSASGTPVARCVMSGMYVNSINFTFPTQGPCTESLTLVGNNKVWNNNFSFTSMNNNHSPRAAGISGGVQQRQDVIFGTCDTSVAQPSACVLPQIIPGISASGTNNLQADGSYTAHIQSIRVSTSLGRDQLFELGKRGPYYRYAQFPTQVTTSIEVTSSAGDNVTCAEESESNLSDYKIWIRTKDGTRLDLGSKNKLSSVSYGGANAQANGGNATATYEFQNFNYLTPYSVTDPAGL